MEEEMRELLFSQTNHGSLGRNHESHKNGGDGGQETLNENDEDEEDKLFSDN